MVKGVIVLLCSMFSFTCVEKDPRSFFPPYENGFYPSSFQPENQSEIPLISSSPPSPINHDVSFANLSQPRKVPMLLPDAAIANLLVTPRRRVAVVIANLGSGPLPLEGGNLRIFVGGHVKGHYRLKSIFDGPSLPPKQTFTFTTPLIIRGRQQIEARIEIDRRIPELTLENNRWKKILQAPPMGPDILIKELDLKEDLDLSVLLSNGGEVDLQKGTTLRVEISLNGRRVSEFDHFMSEPLKAHYGNVYPVDPPYRVQIADTSRVRVSVSSRSPSDGFRLINNSLKRSYIVFPFKLEAQGRKEFSFKFQAPRPKGPPERLKAEVRWEGGKGSLMLSFESPEHMKSVSAFGSKSPLKIEALLPVEAAQKKKTWKLALTNLFEKTAEGHLIVQHP